MFLQSCLRLGWKNLSGRDHSDVSQVLPVPAYCRRAALKTVLTLEPVHGLADRKAPQVTLNQSQFQARLRYNRVNNPLPGFEQVRPERLQGL